MAVRGFRIELERPSGVFYASELIRGKVTLSTTLDIPTRGVQIRFRGEGCCQFNAGRGKERAGIAGRKIYQDTRYTMYGSYFHTSVRQNVGASCEWGDAHGDGTMYMPLDASDLSTPIIVRVCHQEKGDEDLLLGEVAVTLAKLVSDENEHTFALSLSGKDAWGRKGPSTVTLVARLVPFDRLVPLPKGGTAPRMSHALVLQVVRAANLRKSFHAGLNVFCQAYCAPGKIYPGEALPLPDDSEILPAGDHVFPFTLPIRMDTPGNCEVSDETFVQYHLRASLQRAHGRSPSVRRSVTVIPLRPLPAPSLLRPVFTELSDDDVAWFSGFFRSLKSGRPQLRARLDRQVYAPGETLGFTAEVMNNTQQALRLIVRLRQEVYLQTTEGPAHESEVYKHYHILDRIITPGPAITYSSGHLGWPKMPSVPPSFFGVELAHDSKADPVTWTYVLECHLATFDPLGATAEVDIPVFVSPAAPFTSALPATPLAPLEIHGTQNGWGLADEVQKWLNRDIFYFPPIAAPDEASTTAKAVPAGAECGFVESRDGDPWPTADQELTFRPVKEAEKAAAYAVAPAPVALCEGDDAEPAPEDAPVQLLVELLADRDDKGAALRRWTKDHQEELATLAPSQIQDVLGSVPQSMEQPVVARELAGALAADDAASLTCASVAAAMEATPFMKAEVAAAMVQFGVEDPEDRSLILGQLRPRKRQQVEDLLVSVVEGA